MTNLDLVYNVLEDIASVSGKLLKLEKLEKYLKEVPWLEETIEYALNPFKHYKTTKVKEIKVHNDAHPGRLFNFLDILASQKGASKEDKNILNSLASMSPKSVIVVNRIVKKDLRCGIQIKTAQKFIPDLPIYEVMKPFGDNPFPGKKWDAFITLCGGLENVCDALKVDGFRVSYATVFEDQTVEYLSTSGKPYDNFHVFNEELISLAALLKSKYGLPYPMKFDGECISKDADFQTMQSEARKSNFNPEIYRLLLWEVVIAGPFKERYDLLDLLKTTSGEKYDLLKLFGDNPDTKVFRLLHNFNGFKNNQEVIDKTRRVISDGNEGLLLKTFYHEHEYKRSKSWFRIKALYLKGEGIEIDLPVIGFEYGKKGTRMEKMLGSFIVEFNGVRVNISGKMSDAQRMAWVKDLPSVIEVHADSVTNDGSLRLPIFQRPRIDK